MVQDRGGPPPPSLPHDWPWEQLKAVIDGQKAVVAKLDEVIAALRGMPTLPGAPAVTKISINGRLDTLIEKLDDLLRRPPGEPGLDGRLDEIAKSTRNRPGWDHGHMDVVSAGTAVQLPNVVVPEGLELVVRAKPGNTDDIYTGKSKAEASRAASKITMSPGEAIKLKVVNANLVYVDAAVSGEGVEYFVEKD